MESEAQIERTDSEHLKILSICHYVFGALQLMGGLVGLIFLTMGGVFFSGQLPTANPSEQMALQAMGTMFSIFGLVMIGMCLLIGGAFIYAGRCLATTQGYMFCFVVAALECTSFPLGTALGVFTIIVLLRDSVKARFERVKFGTAVDGESD